MVVSTAAFSFGNKTATSARRRGWLGGNAQGREGVGMRKNWKSDGEDVIAIEWRRTGATIRDFDHALISSAPATFASTAAAAI